MLFTFVVVCGDERDDIVKFYDFVFQIIFLLFFVFKWPGNEQQVQD